MLPQYFVNDLTEKHESHCLTIHTYIYALLQCAKHSDKFGGPKGELISFITPPAYSAGISSEEYCTFSITCLHTSLAIYFSLIVCLTHK